MVDPQYVVSEFNTHWENGDLDAAMLLVADACVFTLHVSEDLVDHAGRWAGADQIRTALTTARVHYDYVLYRPVIVGTDGGAVRVRVEFMGTHRLSGERMSMTFRQMFIVESGLIAQCDEYHDRGKLEAYMRLILTYPVSLPGQGGGNG